MAGNRLPSNDNNQPEHIDIVEENGALCDTCRWQTKCHKAMGIMGAIQQLEMMAFKEWTIDLTLMALITYCPQYTPAPVNEQAFIDEDDD